VWKLRELSGIAPAVEFGIKRFIEVKFNGMRGIPAKQAEGVGCVGWRGSVGLGLDGIRA
jgi:hypothetical protein